jgi:hypothetical protein
MTWANFPFFTESKLLRTELDKNLRGSVTFFPFFIVQQRAISSSGIIDLDDSQHQSYYGCCLTSQGAGEGASCYSLFSCWVPEPDTVVEVIVFPMVLDRDRLVHCAHSFVCRW